MKLLTIPRGGGGARQVSETGRSSAIRQRPSPLGPVCCRVLPKRAHGSK
jgi:hypothetical protein